jgi:hypothetical protein
MILLPYAREVDAINVAEKIRRHIAAMPIPSATAPLTLLMSSCGTP